MDARPSPNVRRYRLFPQSLAKASETLLKPIYKQHGFAEHKIITEWYLIVGKELAAASIPQKLTLPPAKKEGSGQKPKTEGGTLHILVASGRALEMEYMQMQIMDKIAAYLGYPAVSRIRITQAAADMFRKAPAAKRREQPQVTPELQALVSVCADDALKQALLSLGRQMETNGHF